MKRIIFETKSNLIYQQMKRDITNGRYKPQQRIVISQVAKEFGTSEIPIREAIRLLEADGLIKNTPYVGAVVTNFDLEDLKKIFQVRTILEGWATRVAVQKIGKKDLELLGRIVSDMEKALHKRQYQAVADLNKEFHRNLYALAGNEYLERMIFELWDFAVRSRAVFALVPKRAQQAIQEHQKILRALEKRDGVLAEKLIKGQLEYSLSHLKTYLERDEAEKEKIDSRSLRQKETGKFI